MTNILKIVANVLTLMGATASAVLLLVGFVQAGMVDLATASYLAALQQFAYAAVTIGGYFHLHFTFNLFGISASTDALPVAGQK